MRLAGQRHWPLAYARSHAVLRGTNTRCFHATQALAHVHGIHNDHRRPKPSNPVAVPVARTGGSRSPPAAAPPPASVPWSPPPGPRHRRPVGCGSPALTQTSSSRRQRWKGLQRPTVAAAKAQGLVKPVAANGQPPHRQSPQAFAQGSSGNARAKRTNITTLY